jgi:plastocyanin
MTNLNAANQPNDQLETDKLAPRSQSNRSGNKVLVSAGLLILVILIATVSYLVFHTSPNTKAPHGESIALTPTKLAPATVSITSTAFVPATISVRPGQAVIWTNTDNARHLVASDPYPNDDALPGLNSQQAIEPSGTYSYVFSKVGTYTYHDNLNPNLTATVLVK